MHSDVKTKMYFRAYVSDHEESGAAVDALIGQAASDFDGHPDVVFYFFTVDHREAAQRAVERICEQLEPQCLIGCSAEGVIGLDREIERSPGMSMLVGQMPRVRLHPFHIAREDWPDMVDDQQMLEDRIAYGPEVRAIIGLGDPFTTPLRPFLARMDEIFPGLPLIGGMASGARRPGESMLVVNDRIHDEGFAGLSLSGNMDVQSLVSQGCRPVGRTMIITRARENAVEQMGGRPALQALRETLLSLSDTEQQLFRNGLYLGRAISEYREQFGRGDFVVRNVIGIDQDKGAIILGDQVRVGQTVQFHVRDAQSASEDLDMLLANQRQAGDAAAALLFSCNGRGSHMFSEPCHDVSHARNLMPHTPVAGFFAAGELGPVGGRNFVHGHTASFALFRPR